MKKKLTARLIFRLLNCLIPIATLTTRHLLFATLMTVHHHLHPIDRHVLRLCLITQRICHRLPRLLVKHRKFIPPIITKKSNDRFRNLIMYTNTNHFHFYQSVNVFFIYLYLSIWRFCTSECWYSGCFIIRTFLKQTIILLNLKLSVFKL